MNMTPNINDFGLPRLPKINTFHDLVFYVDLYAPRLPADPGARSEFTRSEFLLFLAKWGGPKGQGVQGPKGQGVPSGPLGGRAPSAPLGPMGGHWDDYEAIPHGMFS